MFTRCLSNGNCFSCSIASALNSSACKSSVDVDNGDYDDEDGDKDYHNDDDGW